MPEEPGHSSVAARPEDVAPSPGVHLLEWGAELVGTAILLFVVVSAVTFDLGAGSPLARVLPSHSLRLLVTGLIIPGSASLYAVSSPGRRSGAHLNPAVTLAFWLTGHVHRHDLLAYWVSQVAGGLLGTAAGVAVWQAGARSVHYAATQPGPGIPVGVAAAAEALMTAVLLLMTFFLLARARTARLAPLAAWLMVALFVWQVAPVSGTSLNPARSLGPAVFDGQLQWMWIYVVGPVVGAVAAAGMAHLWQHELMPVTAKLFHDPRYRNIFATRHR